MFPMCSLDIVWMVLHICPKYSLHSYGMQYILVTFTPSLSFTSLRIWMFFTGVWMVLMLHLQKSLLLLLETACWYSISVSVSLSVFQTFVWEQESKRPHGCCIHGV
jgi:hypothetical protein